MSRNLFNVISITWVARAQHSDDDPLLSLLLSNMINSESDDLKSIKLLTLYFCCNACIDVCMYVCFIFQIKDQRYNEAVQILNVQVQSYPSVSDLRLILRDPLTDCLSEKSCVGGLPVWAYLLEKAIRLNPYYFDSHVIWTGMRLPPNDSTRLSRFKANKQLDSPFGLGVQSIVQFLLFHTLHYQLKWQPINNYHVYVFSSRELHFLCSDTVSIRCRTLLAPQTVMNS